MIVNKEQFADIFFVRDIDAQFDQFSPFFVKKINFNTYYRL